ncbi:DUF397 domain-containing protein [Streptomyces sp. NPDC051662]|uniref:DUF397 domain-containing protein n=1 Tax=Streptomyces sp. NPDC051662 TaxID=3154750 RepID=UPI0034251A78
MIADVRNSGFAHAPSGHFQANAALLALAALAHNLTRATGALASAFHARATTATIRDRLINVPARLARSARASGGGRAVRDSKNPSGPALLFGADEWQAFVRGAADGEFN